MSRFEAEPHPMLRPFVRSYWGFARDLSQMRRFTVTPDCFLELIFFVDAPFVEEAGGRRQLSACTLIPLLSEPLRLVTDGYVRCASVRLHAWAAGMILPEADASTRPWHDVRAPFAGLVPSVTEALRREAWDEIAAIFDAALLRTMADARPAGASALAAVQSFIRPLDGASIAATDDVAARHGRSRRQIERQVRSLTKRSPKQLACLNRFQFVRDTLWARPDTELDALAIEAGYADQAHLSRHFRRYAAQSPSEFKRDCLRLKAFLRPQDVAFVQDSVRNDNYTGSI